MRDLATFGALEFGAFTTNRYVLCNTRASSHRVTSLASLPYVGNTERIKSRKSIENGHELRTGCTE